MRNVSRWGRVKSGSLPVAINQQEQTAASERTTHRSTGCRSSVSPHHDGTALKGSPSFWQQRRTDVDVCGREV